MRRHIVILVFGLYPSLINAQIIFIDKTSKDYSFNEKTFEIDKKVCYTINATNTNYAFFIESEGIKPLIFFKVFDFENKKQLIIEKPLHFMSLENYVKNNAMAKLKADLYLYINTLGNVSHESNINVFDSLVIYDGKNYKLMTGVVEVNFYNLMDFKQTHIQQCNQTIINTMAIVAPLIRNEFNGQIEVNIDSTEQMDTYGKLYLIKKTNDLYTYRWVQIGRNEDSPFDYYYREFVYKRDIGIVSFKSPYFFKSYEFERGIHASKEMYEFK